MSHALRYALISPVRDEAMNLPRLAECIAAQTTLPTVWLIVDNGSSDGTLELARALEVTYEWVCVLEVQGAPAPQRGAPIVRAFHAGLDVLADKPEVVVKLDADLSMGDDYFARLLAEFASEPRLGITSGTCWELVEGRWRPQHVTRDHVRGAARAYRLPPIP
jgi:glycosyltransferase involved in cell wall biosynthesis